MIEPRDGGAFVPALAEVLEVEERWLASLAVPGREVLLEWLARRLLSLARSCLVEVGGAPTPALWARVALERPALARVCQRARDEWRRQVTLFGERLGRDFPGEGATGVEILGSRSSLPPSAIGVTLASGRRLVYKPRDVRIGAWFMELARELNERGLRLPLHVRRIVAGPEHAWDERVDAAPCRDAGEVERFFVRAGALLRLLQALRAVDMHRRNLVAAGEHPAIVDFDGLFRPALPDRSWLERSPYATGLLPMWVVGEPGRRALNGGGLQIDGNATVPMRRPRFSDDGLALEAGFAREASPATAPASPYAHRDRVLDGYGDMERALGRVDLRARLAGAAELPVRFFPRPVAEAEHYLARSLVPERAVSDEARERYLAARVDGPLAAEERAALADGFLPIFTVAPGGRALRGPGGSRREEFFPGAALDAVTLEHDGARDREVIVTALALGEPGLSAAPPAAGGKILDWRAAAAQIADDAIDAGLDVGAAWVPWAGVRRLGPLPPDVLSGSAGIAMALARLSVATGSARYRDAARRALALVARAVGRRARWYGAFIGLGGQLHALLVCGALFEERAPIALAQARIAALRNEAALDDAGDDLVGGLAGLAAALPEAWLGDRLLERRRRGLRPPPYLEGGLPPSLPGLDEGVAWALGQIASHTGDARYRVETPPPAPPRTSLEALERALDGKDAGAATRAAAEIAGRREATGSWLPESHVADRLHPSAVTGVLAVALAFLRLASLPGVP